MTELLDIFDKNYNPVAPFRESKEIVHKLGLWHHTFHCFMVENKENKVFFQLNRKKNNNFKPLLTPSSAGHIQSGEKIENGVREIKEELGIDVAFSDLSFVGMQKRVADYFETGYHDREFIHVYILPKSLLSERIKLDKTEVNGLFSINIQDGLDLFRGVKQNIIISGIELENGEYLHKKITVSQSDFVVQPENYYLNIFQTAEKICK